MKFNELAINDRFKLAISGRPPDTPAHTYRKTGMFSFWDERQGEEFRVSADKAKKIDVEKL